MSILFHHIESLFTFMMFIESLSHHLLLDKKLIMGLYSFFFLLKTKTNLKYKEEK